MRHHTGAALVAVMAASLSLPSGLRAQPSLVLPAFTAYLHPDAEGAAISPRQPVAPFGVAPRELVWYARVPSSGTLTSTLLAHSTSTAGSPSLTQSLAQSLTLKVGGTTYRAQAPRIAGDSVQLDFGPIAVRDTGYLRFALSNRQPTPLVIDGLRLAGIAGLTANTEPRRNAASVHLRYPIDSTWSVTGFYTEVTAIDDPVTTYYMATGFARGYFGMQVNSPTERRIIFSVWDAAEGQTAANRSTVASENRTSLLAKGDGVVAEVFGNEGTGGHSHLVYPWKAGDVQRFFVTATPVGSATEYRGYWYHPDHRAWMLIAAFSAPKDGGYLRRLYSFSENFSGSTGDLRRKARYGAQWVRLADGSWHELTTATFTHDPTGKTARLDRFAGVEDGRFFLSHGGFGPGYLETGSTITRPATGTPPVIALQPSPSTR